MLNLIFLSILVLHISNVLINVFYENNIFFSKIFLNLKLKSSATPYITMTQDNLLSKN